MGLPIEKDGDPILSAQSQHLETLEANNFGNRQEREERLQKPPDVWSEDSGSVQRSVETLAYPERVWDALTDTELLSHWLADKATGWMAVGGTLELFYDRFNLTVDYKVSDLRVCERLVWKSPMGNGLQTITFTLRRQGRSTWVDLKDQPPSFTPPNPHSTAGSTWQMSLAVLKLYVERYFRQPRRSFMVVARATFTFAEIVAAYSTREGLERWLADEVAEWKGDSFKFRQADGTTMSGRVLTITESEALISWDEIHGFLELKSFSSGPGNQMICLRGSGYKLSAERAEELEASLKPRVIALADLLEA